MNAASAAGLTAGGWLFLIAAWGIIASVTAFCFLRVLKTQGKNKS